MSLAPLVVGSTVMIGASGGEFGVRGFIAAYDIETGRERWKTYMVPAPGEPGSETWPKGDQWKTGGGSVWITGNYDPETNLAFWGTGNGGPWMGDQRPGDNLYTSSTVAIDVATGAIKGHFQYHPNDSWDWDEVSPPILVDYRRNGRTIKGLIDVARNGYLWFLERTDGRVNFVEGKPYVKQNVFASLDPKTGRPNVDPARQPGTNKRAEFCPSHWGGKNWPPIAYSPDTRMIYIPANENLCSSMIGKPVTYMAGKSFTGAANTLTIAPGAEHIGEVQAWNVDTGARVWTHTFRELDQLGADAGDRRRAGVQRRHQRSDVPRLRRRHRQGALAGANAVGRHRPALVVHGGWDAVHRGPVGLGDRRALDAAAPRRNQARRISRRA